MRISPSGIGEQQSLVLAHLMKVAIRTESDLNQNRIRLIWLPLTRFAKPFGPSFSNTERQPPFGKSAEYGSAMVGAVLGAVGLNTSDEILCSVVGSAPSAAGWPLTARLAR